MAASRVATITPVQARARLLGRLNFVSRMRVRARAKPGCSAPRARRRPATAPLRARMRPVRAR